MILLERFETTQENSVETLGTVKEIVGKGGTIYYSNSNNVKDATKRLMITLEDKAGKAISLLASPALTRQLRSKEASLKDVMFCPVYVTTVTTKEGDEIERPVIGVNQGESLKGLHSVKADDVTAPKVRKTSLTDYEGYIAF